MENRLVRFVVLGWVAVLAWSVPRLRERLSGGVDTRPPGVVETPDSEGRPPAGRSEAADWFAAMKPYCNPVEIGTHVAWRPPPEGFPGAGWSAACSALAGRIDDARAAIDALPADQRWQAAGIVFNVAHPVADAGDDLAAGPVMELVVDYWPNHYQALYHAGAARFALDDHEAARDYLERFLRHYERDDWFTRNARRMLDEVDAGR